MISRQLQGQLLEAQKKQAAPWGLAGMFYKPDAGNLFRLSICSCAKMSIFREVDDLHP